MKKLSIVFLALIFALPSLAEQTCVVDIQKVLNDSTAGKAAKSSLESKFKGKKEKLDSHKKEVISMQDELKKQSGVLSDDALQSKAESFRKREKEVAREFQDFQEEFTRENGTKVSKIMERVYDIVNELAEEKKCSTVLEKNDRIVLYASPAGELTKDVISKLNQENISF